jgi:hypothetical protein
MQNHEYKYVYRSVTQAKYTQSIDQAGSIEYVVDNCHIEGAIVFDFINQTLSVQQQSSTCLRE